MIVREQGAALLLVTQPDHAALAGQIMAAWQSGAFVRPEWREAALAATREHDNGWTEVDAHPTISPASGRPFDFINIPAPVKRSIWPRAVVRLAPARPDVAALVAQHALALFDGFREQDEWREFLTRMEQARDQHLAAIGLRPFGSRQEFLRAYRVIFMGDLLSLIFCCGWTRPFAEAGYHLALRDERLTVSPDPFGGAEVPLSIQSRAIPVRRYGSDDELRDAVASAEIFDLKGTLSGC